MKSTLISVVLFLVTLLTAVTVFAQAHPNHHPNGDCQYFCDASCLGYIKYTEEQLGNGACTNWVVTGPGPVAGTCRSDHAGPVNWELSCDAQNGCSAAGKLRCPIKNSQGQTIGINFPDFGMSCGTSQGQIPRAMVSIDYAECLNADNTMMTISCADNGNLVTTITF